MSEMIGKISLLHFLYLSLYPDHHFRVIRNVFSLLSFRFYFLSLPIFSFLLCCNSFSCPHLLFVLLALYLSLRPLALSFFLYCTTPFTSFPLLGVPFSLLFPSSFLKHIYLLFLFYFYIYVELKNRKWLPPISLTTAIHIQIHQPAQGCGSGARLWPWSGSWESQGSLPR